MPVEIEEDRLRGAGPAGEQKRLREIEIGRKRRDHRVAASRAGEIRRSHFDT